MLKVLLVDETSGRKSPLREALAGADGVELACALESPAELAKRAAEHRPDIILVQTGSPSRAVLDALAAVSSTAPRPIVMFTEDSQDEAIRAALKAGVSAYVVDGLAAARLEPIMRVAIERFDAEQRLRGELADAKALLAERKLVERAKGILMKQRGLSEDAAFTALRSHAMQRGLRLGEAARQIIEVSALIG